MMYPDVPERGIIGRSAVANEYSGILSDYHAENSHAEFSKM